jgi:CRP-like cAMP-binding protein
MSGVRQIGPFDRILYLKSLPGIGALTSEQVARVATGARELNFEAGQNIFEPGEVVRRFMVLATGAANLHRQDTPVERIVAPQTVGLMETLAENSTTGLVAESDVVALSFERTDILELLEEDFDLLQTTVQSLAEYQLRLLRQVIAGTVRGEWEPLVEIPTDRPLDLLERLIMIRQGDLFSAVGLEAAVMMATSMKQVEWAAGDVLWERGDPSGAMYLIASGEIEAQLDDERSFVARPGYPLGNIELLAHQPRWYRPVARTDIIGFRADHETFFDVMEDDFEVAETFLKAMATGILGAENAIMRSGRRLHTDR